jgi:hypothetical protein
LSSRNVAHEAKALQLKHIVPLSPTLHRVFALAHRRYIVLEMECLNGTCLANFVPASAEDLEQTIRLAAAPIIHMHDKRYYHGDLTPGNLWYGFDNAGKRLVYLLDLSNLSPEGQRAAKPLCTPGFFRGADVCCIRADWFAFGQIIFSLVSEFCEWDLGRERRGRERKGRGREQNREDRDGERHRRSIIWHLLTHALSLSLCLSVSLSNSGVWTDPETGRSQ